MGNKLYVGNLPYSATDSSLQSLFAQAGTVSSAKVITDRDTGRSKGFGFVEMASDEEAQDAISKFDGHDMEGRTIKVSEARPQAPRGNRPSFNRNNGNRDEGQGGRGSYGRNNRY